jgi:hypothetical protein
VLAPAVTGISGERAVSYTALPTVSVPMTEHTVVDLLPKDAIPSIDDPTFGRSGEGDPEEQVTVVSLDVPTGRDATTGEQPGVAVGADAVVTLALPKTGLAGLECTLLLADITVPPVVYERLDIAYEGVFDGEYLVELKER